MFATAQSLKCLLQRPARPRPLKMVRSKLLYHGLISAIGAEVGKIYQPATLYCITGGAFLGLRPSDDETLPSRGAKVSKVLGKGSKAVRGDSSLNHSTI